MTKTLSTNKKQIKRGSKVFHIIKKHFADLKYC